MRSRLQRDATCSSTRITRFKITASGAAAGETVESVVAALRGDPDVRIAEPDYEVHVAALPNDPEFPQQWALRNTGQMILGNPGKAGADISAADAWDVTTGSGDVIVAVIDTGVDYGHEDLSDNILRNASGNVVGYNYSAHTEDPMDDNGHGTHVAGIVGASGNNALGCVGVNWTVGIMPIKFLNADGSGFISDAILATDFARENGARIINNSWGGTDDDPLLLEAIQRARDAGILYVAAAGNSGRNNDITPFYPASYNARCDNVLSVAATDSQDRLAWFSNYGEHAVDIAAPGYAILSTTPRNTYSYLSGTSMAAPHVSGAAALVMAQYPDICLADLKARLLSATDEPSSLSGLVATGRLNAAAALVPDIVPGADRAIASRSALSVRQY